MFRVVSEKVDSEKVENDCWQLYINFIVRGIKKWDSSCEVMWVLVHKPALLTWRARRD